MGYTEYAEDNRLVAASVAIYLDIISLFAPELPLTLLRILGYFETESED